MKDAPRDRTLAWVAGALLSMRDAAISQLGRRKRIDARALDLIERSSLFDADWYLRVYPDVAEAKANPLHHYMTVGWHEGRDPGPEFSSSAYLKANRDVAQAGVNPLLHFIEFGQQEGRGSASHIPTRKPLPPALTEFGPAAPCVSFPLPDEQPIRWRRAYQLPSLAERFSVGECIVGMVADDAMRASLKRWLSLLKTLSGYREAVPAPEQIELPRSADRMLDAWYLNSQQLRTRWRSQSFPVVVRAFQHDPLQDGMLSLVGEGLAASPIDAVDLHLRSPYFPLLFVFSTPDGTIRAAELLPFPSLCRGGAHYSELLYSAALAQSDELDPVGTGGALASQLLHLDRASNPAVASIEVEIEGADGRTRMFQPDFQLWLQKVFRIRVASIGAASSRTAQFLTEAVAVPPSTESRAGGAALRISSDMIPAIGILTEAKKPDHESAAPLTLALLVAGTAASQPAIAVQLPQRALARIDGVAAARAPQLSQGPERLRRRPFPAAAIAFPAERDMTDATLFVPATGTASTGPRSAITWIVEARGWEDAALPQAIVALSVQHGGQSDFLSFVGAPDPFSQAVARERMTGETNFFDELGAAIAAAPTAIVGYVAAGVLLHDARTATVLASILDDERVATATCALVAVDQSRAGWHASIADAGSFAVPSGTTLGRAEREAVTAYLWGSSYPVTVPGSHLWVAHKTSLTEWLQAPTRHLANGVHVCSSEVTVSYIGKEPRPNAPAHIPPSMDDQATQVRALFG